MNTEQELEKYRATASSVCRGCLFEHPRSAAVLPAWPAAATSFDRGQAWPLALLVLIHCSLLVPLFGSGHREGITVDVTTRSLCMLLDTFLTRSKSTV